MKFSSSKEILKDLIKVDGYSCAGEEDYLLPSENFLTFVDDLTKDNWFDIMEDSRNPEKAIVMVYKECQLKACFSADIEPGFVEILTGIKDYVF